MRTTVAMVAATADSATTRGHPAGAARVGRKGDLARSGADRVVAGYNWGMAGRRYDEERLRDAVGAARAVLRERYGEQLAEPAGGGPALAEAGPGGGLGVDDPGPGRGGGPARHPAAPGGAGGPPGRRPAHPAPRRAGRRRGAAVRAG